MHHWGTVWVLSNFALVWVPISKIENFKTKKLVELNFQAQKRQEGKARLNDDEVAENT